MKKIVAFAGFSLLAVGAFAQTNLQVFYDFGDKRNYVTTTLEMFKTDDWGSTFFFVDYDYANKDVRDTKRWGATNSYFEIARALNFWQDSSLGALSAHVEFNAGVNFGYRNWLFGVEYLLHNDDFSNTFTFELMYKTFNENIKSDIPLQFTFVWGMQDLFGVEGLRFSGFADFWGQNNKYEDGLDEYLQPKYKDTKFVFVSEPQLWYNVGSLFGCPNFNVGTEIELGYNFVKEGFACNPCLGVKWDF